MKYAKIGIVTVLYNSSAVVEDFFVSLAKQTYKNIILYVVDNCSPDDSLEKCRQLIDLLPFEVKVYTEETNWGVAKGNNIGIIQALADGCDYVLLSNNDTVLEPTTIENLFNGMLSANATLAVPKIYFYGTNKIWAAGGKFVKWKGSTKHFGFMEVDKGQWNTPSIVQYAPSCFMLIDGKVFERVGIMNEHYFVYYDDTDFVWRAVKKGTERLAYIPNSRLWHKENTSTGGNQSDFFIYYFNRNNLYFTRMHFSLLWRLWVYGFCLAKYLIKKPFTMTSHQRSIMRKAYSEAMRLGKK